MARLGAGDRGHRRRGVVIRRHAGEADPVDQAAAADPVGDRVLHRGDERERRLGTLVEVRAGRLSGRRSHRRSRGSHIAEPASLRPTNHPIGQLDPAAPRRRHRSRPRRARRRRPSPRPRSVADRTPGRGRRDRRRRPGVGDRWSSTVSRASSQREQREAVLEDVRAPEQMARRRSAPPGSTALA